MFDKSKVKYIIFDMDGTLLDNISPLAETYASMIFDTFGLDNKIGRAHFMNAMGVDLFSMLRNLCDAHKIPHHEHEAFVTAFRQKAMEIPHTPFPDVPGALEKLSKKYTLIVSSAPTEETIDEKLTVAGVRKYFSILLGHEPTKGYTKGPKHVDEFMKRTGTTKEELRHVIFVGDARKDMEIATRAGMVAIGREGTFSSERLKEYGAATVIKDLDELVEILKV